MYSHRVNKNQRSKSIAPYDVQPSRASANRARRLARRSSRRGVRQALRHYRGISVCS